VSVAGRLARLLGAPLAIAEPVATLDAIVVLGAPLLPDGRPSDVVAERIAAALDLWRRAGAPIVCVTGGSTGAGHNEADAMAGALLAGGLPAAALRRERASRSTDDNARLSAALLAADGVRSVWLVTQPFHGRRARRCFRRAGLDAHVWAIADSIQHRQPRRALRWITREYAAWLREVVRRPPR
jgi:uncharacterized SAM-binding protein YcdF (DUF218 family)